MIIDDAAAQEIHAGIYEIVNFIPRQLLSDLIDYCRNVDEQAWFDKNTHGLFVEINGVDAKAAIEFYLVKLKIVFEESTVLPISRIARLTQGGKMHGHTDNLSESRCTHGVILYLNDDFEGGELYYRDLGVSYKPRAGSVIIHDSSYYHEVLEVTKGTRYVATTFVWKQS